MVLCFEIFQLKNDVNWTKRRFLGKRDPLSILGVVGNF